MGGWPYGLYAPYGGIGGGKRPSIALLQANKDLSKFGWLGDQSIGFCCSMRRYLFLQERQRGKSGMSREGSDVHKAAARVAVGLQVCERVGLA